MGYKTKVQLIRRAKSAQWYICFPTAMAQALEFKKSEIVEWIIETKHKLILWRRSVRKKGQGKKKGSPDA